MGRWERVGMEVGRRGEWVVCVKRDDNRGIEESTLEEVSVVNTATSDCNGDTDSS